MSQAERVRLFLDSNVLTAGIVSTWGLDKAVLSLCAARICRLVLAEAVRDEVDENLLVRLGGLETAEANRVRDDYARLIALMKPEVAPYAGQEDVKASRHRLLRGGLACGSQRRLSSFGRFPRASAAGNRRQPTRSDHERRVNFMRLGLLRRVWGDGAGRRDSGLPAVELEAVGLRILGARSLEELLREAGLPVRTVRGHLPGAPPGLQSS